MLCYIVGAYKGPDLVSSAIRVREELPVYTQLWTDNSLQNVLYGKTVHFVGPPRLWVQRYFAPLSGLLLNFHILISKFKRRERRGMDIIPDQSLYEADFLEALNEFEKAIKLIKENLTPSIDETSAVDDAEPPRSEDEAK